MVIERAEIPVKPGDEDTLAAVMRDKGIAMLEAAQGCRSARCGRGVEDPSKFILLIEWDSVDAHVAYTKTPEFDTFKGLIGPHFAGAPAMEHFEPIS